MECSAIFYVYTNDIGKEDIQKTLVLEKARILAIEERRQDHEKSNKREKRKHKEERRNMRSEWKWGEKNTFQK